MCKKIPGALWKGHREQYPLQSGSHHYKVSINNRLKGSFSTFALWVNKLHVLEPSHKKPFLPFAFYLFCMFFRFLTFSRSEVSELAFCLLVFSSLPQGQCHYKKQLSHLSLCLQKGYLSPTPSEERPPRVGFPLSLQKGRNREPEVPASTAKQDALCIKQEYACYYIMCFKCFRKGITLGDPVQTSGQCSDVFSYMLEEIKDIFNNYGDYSKGKASQISSKNLVVVYI